MNGQRGSVEVSVMSGLAVVSLLLAGFVALGRWKPTREAAAAAKSASAAPAAPKFKLGEIVRIDPAATAITLSLTTQVAAAEERLTLAEDFEGIRELMQAQAIYVAPAAGRVRILGFDAYPEVTRRLGTDTVWVHVRIVDGEHEGRVGWVDAAKLAR